MEAIIKFFCRLLYKLCYVIGKYVCKAIGAVCKFAWNTGRFLYRQHQKKNAVVAADVESSEIAEERSSSEMENSGNDVAELVAGGGENE